MKLNKKLYIFFLAILFLMGSVYSAPRLFAQQDTTIGLDPRFLTPEDDLPPDPIVANDPRIGDTFNKIDSAPSAISTTTKPNVVVIMIDDTNPHDGRMWKAERTPAIYNNIISKGIQFTNTYGETPLCCPGRVGFLTGQHTQNHGVDWNDGTVFKPGTTIATELQAKGYYTMLTGKYVNEFNKIPTNKAVPPGWTKFDGIYAGNGKYYSYKLIHKNGTTTQFGTTAADYSTDVIANYAVKRLKEAPVDKPIFAYITPFAVHEPFTMAPRHRGDSRCRYIASWKTPNSNESDVSDKPLYVRQVASRAEEGWNLKSRCEMLLSVDDLVRRVKDELVRQKRLNNTIFIFIADNGMSWGEHRWGNKTVPWTASIPLYIAWPAGRGTAPIQDSTYISNIDLAPTLCEMAGCEMGPYPNGQTKSDGVSFFPLLKNQIMDHPRDAILEQMANKTWDGAPKSRPGWYGIRTTPKSPLGLWHYVEYENGEKELYDSSNGPCIKWTPDKGGDPCELENLLRSDQTPSPETLVLQQALALRLSQLKAEEGYQPTPSVTPTISFTPTPTLTITPTPTL